MPEFERAPRAADRARRCSSGENGPLEPRLPWFLAQVWRRDFGNLDPRAITPWAASCPPGTNGGGTLRSACATCTRAYRCPTRADTALCFLPDAFVCTRHVGAATLSSRHGTMSDGPMVLRGALLCTPSALQHT
eukprot:1748136-Prymnesium_polylepis.1